MFLQIRAKSIGEIMKLRLKCPDDEKQIVDYDLNLQEVKVTTNKDHKDTIEFSPGYGVVLKSPTILSYDSGKDKKTETQIAFKVLNECIKSIYKGEDVYDRNNLSDEEVEEYINNLTQDQYKKLMVFFDTMPRIRHRIEYENPVTHKKFALVFNGAADFFLSTLSHESLENYYRTNFLLMQHHKYSLTELENMLPWEREIYIDMLVEHIREENEKIKEQQMNRRG